MYVAETICNLRKRSFMCFGLARTNTFKITTINVKPMTTSGANVATAYFVPKGTMYDLVISHFSGGGDINGARIVSNPPGIDCYGGNPAGWSHPFPAGTYVTLTAEHVTGIQLMGWGLLWPYLASIYLH